MVYKQGPHSGTPTAYWISYYFIGYEIEFAGNYRTSEQLFFFANKHLNNSKLLVRC
jgi:hypothetical protein